MSISIPTIRDNLKFEISNDELELNAVNQDFNEVYSFIGYGYLISACFKLSKEQVLFKFEVDGNVVCDLSVEDLSSISHTSNINYPTPIVYDPNDRVLIVKYDSAINFSRNIKFLFKRTTTGNNNNARVQLQSYAVSLTKEENS